MKPASFRLLAAIILLPVLVLAGVAAYGLMQRRASLRAEAQAQCSVRSFPSEWALTLEEAAENSPHVVLYDDPPLPQRATSDERHKPLSELSEAELLAEMGGWGSARHISSGLPPHVLAGWEWIQRHWAPGHAPPAPQQVEYFMRHVLVESPSAISPVILERLTLRYPAQSAAWRKTWESMELKRAVLRHAAPRYQPGRVAPLQVLVLPVTASGSPELTAELKDRQLSDAPALELVHRTGSVAMVYPKQPGTARVLLEDELRAAFRIMQDRTRRMLPPWAAVDVRMKPTTLATWSINLQLASLGEPLPEVLNRADHALFIIETGPREKGWLTRDFHRLVWWAVGIIGGALLTACLGLWLVRRTLQKERRLGELKSQFVSSVSHELRAPIGSLRLMAEGLASGRVQGTAAAEFHRLMAGEGARLSSLIENVLDFARIEQGRKDYVRAETDVAALLTDAVALMQPQAEAKGLRIVLECEPLPFVPKVDAGAIQQAVINLLDNAVKFTPGEGVKVESESDRSAGGGLPQSKAGTEPDSTFPFANTILVRLAAGPSPATWSITVADQGPGIPAAEHARIFERFYRLGNELRRETTGTGIGLAIVKHIVEGHGGRVGVTSEPGRGSEFFMMFPTEKQAL